MRTYLLTLLLLGLAQGAFAQSIWVDDFKTIEKNGFKIRLRKSSLRSKVFADCTERQVVQLVEALTPANLAKLHALEIDTVQIDQDESNLLLHDISESPELWRFVDKLIIETFLTSSWFGIEDSRSCKVVSAGKITDLIDHELEKTQARKSDAERAAEVVANTEKALEAATTTLGGPAEARLRALPLEIDQVASKRGLAGAPVDGGVPARAAKTCQTQLD